MEQQLITTHDKLSAMETDFRKQGVRDRSTQTLLDRVAEMASAEAGMEAALNEEGED